jgi:hypothetical protein
MRKPNITQMGHKKLLQTYKNWLIHNTSSNDPKISGIIYCMEKEILSRMPWSEEPNVKKASSNYYCEEMRKWGEWYTNYCNSDQ